MHDNPGISSHSHPENAASDVSSGEAKLVKVLDYMVSHNTEHRKELAGIADKLRELGKPEAADAISEAVTSYEGADSMLAAAADTLKGVV